MPKFFKYRVEKISYAGGMITAKTIIEKTFSNYSTVFK